EAAVTLNDSRVEVLSSRGNGTFDARATVAVGREPSALAAADLDGDRLVDLMTACQGSNYVTIVRGLGGGEFVNASRPSFVAGDAPVGAALGAINGDGKMDLVVANETSHSVSVLLGLGDGAFRQAAEITTGFVPHGVVLTRINQDG